MSITVRFVGAEVRAGAVVMNAAIGPELGALDGAAALVVVMSELPTTEDQCVAIGNALGGHLLVAITRASEPAAGAEGLHLVRDDT